jgi:ankyrin repeat protein
MHLRFLLAQLHIDSLMSHPTLGHIKQALRNLPQGFEGLDETYRQAMERITHQPEGYRKLANQLLSWVTHAKRALSPGEIQHALAVEAGVRELDKDFLLEIEIFGSICAGLITVDTNSNVVRLVHYTTKEYLMRTSSFKDAQTDITIVCVTYLSFNAFETGSCKSNQEFKTRLHTNVLYNYAARYWGYHAHTAATKEDLILDLLESRAKVSAASQAMMVSEHRLSSIRRVPLKMTGVHVAAYFGIEWAIKGLLNNRGNLEKVDIDSGDTDGRTPLSWAAEKGNEAVVKLLLETGQVDVDSKDTDGRTPLLWAAEKGNEAVVKLLLETGKVDVDSKNTMYGRTPLSWAAGNGNEAVVKLLLETSKVDVDSKNTMYGRTSLSWAAGDGNEAVVKLLLETGKVDVDSKDTRGRTPLLWAAEKGNEAVVKLLLETGQVDVDSKDTLGRTPLSLAVKERNEAVVKVLLETGQVDVNSKNTDRWTPLL